MLDAAIAPKIKAIELESVCVVDQGGRKSNLEKVMALGLPICTQHPERGEPLAIVASGPSVRDYLEELRTWPGELWAINGAYDYLLDNEIVPRGFFAIDPLPGLADYVRRAKSETTFYMASTTDPAVFEALKGQDVQLFHPVCEDLEYPDGWSIGGGTTALTRAPYLGLLQGFRDITLYGCDSSYHGGEYCYQWGRYACDIDQPKVWVDLYDGGPVFETEVGLVKQVSQMGVIIQKFNGMLKIRCGGLMDAFLKAPIMSDECIEVEKPDARADAA
jgi:hypothetical protein